MLTLCLHVGVWFLNLLAYGLFPLSLSQAIYHLFIEVLATAPVYWLIVLVTPFACVLPGFFIRQAWRCSSLFPLCASCTCGKDCAEEKRECLLLA